MNKKWILLIGLLLGAIFLLTACQGPQGEEGQPGPAGPPGPEGPQGPPGEAAEAPPTPAEPAAGMAGAEYVGSTTCGGCHKDIYDTFINSGHPWKLNKIVDGQAPVYPFRELAELPQGYTWDDISYVIGGYWWKARFMDKEGYIITDEPGTTGNTEYLNQWNYANDYIPMDAGWVTYHSGEEKLPFDCGACHTTGYSPNGNQDDLPGIVGTWAEPGVQCEACHGPGSLHMANPQGVKPVVNRSAEMCGECHRRGDVEFVDAKGGFIEHHEQYEEMYQGKHIVLECTDCHDPHTGVKQLEAADLPTTRTQCVNCHADQARYQKNQMHKAINLACVECHMPRIVKTAWGDPETFTGDIRTHLMSINPAQIEQFYTVVEGDTEKSYSYSEIGLNYACRHCHVQGKGSVKTDEELVNAAYNYHEKPVEAPPVPTSVPTATPTP